MVKLMEIYESTQAHARNSDKKFSLREVYINPQQVVCIGLEPSYKKLLMEGRLPTGLDDHHEFSRIYLNRGQSGIDVVVVGSPTNVENKLILSRDKKLLKG